MKTKDIKNLREKTIEELRAMVKDARTELSNLLLEKAQYKLKNTRSIFLKRKDLAQIQTVMMERELGEKEGK